MIPVCKEIRKEILKISNASGHGHIPTCFSIVEIMYAVYSNMKHYPKNPLWEERDVFLLSKGHATLGHYCTLAKLDILISKGCTLLVLLCQILVVMPTGLRCPG